MGEAAMMVVWMGLNATNLSDNNTGKHDLVREEASYYEEQELPSSMQEPPLFPPRYPSSLR